MKRHRAAGILYGGSIALHGVLLSAAILAPAQKRHEATAIAIAETKKAKPAPRDDKTPPPPPPPPAAARAKTAAAPKPAPAKPAAAPPPVAAPPAPAFTDLGLTMGNGSGPGLAVGSRSTAASSPLPDATTTRKVAALAPKSEDACAEPAVKPKPRSIVKPVYTDDARAAQIEGTVRVEITVDPTGQVVDAKILRGLGHGLDEAAIAAARQMTFEPGTRCGKASVATLSVGIRFALGS